MAPYNSPIGAPVVRAEGPDKVTGRALYAADIALPGMLWGKVLRSPHPHARILQVTAARAERFGERNWTEQRATHRDRHRMKAGVRPRLI